MDIRVLNYFVSVVQQKSISRAAESLHMTQPTLSRQIKDLEEELGTTLLIRGSREIQVTEDGQYLYNRAIEILNLVNKTEQNIKNHDEISGDLYIGAAETQSLDLVARASQKLLEKYPDIKLNFHSGNADEIFEKIDNGILDIGVIIGNVDHKKYDVIKLPIHDKWGVLVPNDHPLVNKGKLTFKDILDYPLIVSSQSTHPQDAFVGMGDYRIVATYNLLYNASKLVEAGVGIALCLDGIVNNPNLSFIKVDMNHIESFHIIWKRHLKPSQVARVFLDAVENELKN